MSLTRWRSITNMSMRIVTQGPGGGDLRIVRHRPPARQALQFTFDGQAVPAFEGEVIAAALWAAGYRRLRRSPTDNTPRGMFCAMGSCQECAVLVDGLVRTACNTPVSARLDVRAIALAETGSE